MEEWKVCFENYEISNLGNCRRKKKNGEYLTINGSIQSRGYRYFQVQREGKRINKLFHHLVAEQFICERPNGLVIDHIDRNPLNNNVSNLRYITQEENLHNTSRYRTDLPTDKKERLRLQQLEYDIKSGHTRNILPTKNNNIPYKKRTDIIECDICKIKLKRHSLWGHKKNACKKNNNIQP